MKEIKKFPAYKEAVDQIVKRFHAEGYGIIITDEEFDSFMSIKTPLESMTYNEYKALETERL